MPTTRIDLATAFLTMISVLLSSRASATTLNQFDDLSRDQQAKFLVNAVHKIVADVAPINPDLSRAIRNYFEIPAQGHTITPGMIAFVGLFLVVEKQTVEDKFDRDNVHVEAILGKIAKNNIMPKLQADTPALLSVPDESLEEEWKVTLAALTKLRLEQIGRLEKELHQKIQEADCRTIRLHDGRKVLVGEHGEYVDKESNQVLHGADAAEASRNVIDLSDPAILKKYHECLAQHGILDLDITTKKQ